MIELNNKVQQLQDQVGLLSENQAATDERYSIVKADNVKLTAKIHVLEENIREIEMRGEERLVDEQRRNRDMIQRLEREKQLEIENYSIRLQVGPSNITPHHTASHHITSHNITSQHVISWLFSLKVSAGPGEGPEVSQRGGEQPEVPAGEDEG